MNIQNSQYVPFGKLALEAGFRYRIQVLHSSAGFYIGTADENNGPISRESVEYFQSHKAASEAMSRGEWTQKENP